MPATNGSAWESLERGWAFKKTPDYLGAPILVVLVHGYNGSTLRTWGDLPDDLLGRGDPVGDPVHGRVAIVSYDYAATAFEKTELDDVASDLARWLRKMSKNPHQQIVFVAHSTGGLVVQRMLNGQAGRDSENDLWQKTRKVVFVAVPHHGVRPLYRLLGRFVYPGFELAARVPVWIVRRSRGSPRITGRNRLIDVLCRPRLARAIHDEFLSKSAIREARPFPRHVDFVASAEDLCAKIKRTVGGLTGSAKPRTIEKKVLGTHTSIKMSQIDRQPLCDDVREELDWGLATSIQYYTLRFVPKIQHGDHATGMSHNRAARQQLLEEGDIINYRYMSQAGTCEYLSKEFSTQLRNGTATPALVLTGNENAGKTALLREFAINLAKNLLEAPRKQLLQIFIPLGVLRQRVERDADFRDRYRQLAERRPDDPEAQERWTTEAAQLIRDWYCDWASGALGFRIGAEWLEERLRRAPTVFILDDPQAMFPLNREGSELLGRVGHALATGRGLGVGSPRTTSVVISVRNDPDFVIRLSTTLHHLLHGCEVIEIAPYADASDDKQDRLDRLAEEMRRARQIADPKFRTFVHEVLMPQGHVTAEDVHGSGSRRTFRIMTSAMSRIVDEMLKNPDSRIPMSELRQRAKLRGETGDTDTMDSLYGYLAMRDRDLPPYAEKAHWRLALAFLARTFTDGEAASQSEKQIVAALRQLSSLWVRKLRQSKGKEPPSAAPAVACALLRHRQTRLLLLRYTVLRPTVGDRFGDNYCFVDEFWREYLFGVYLDCCARIGFADELTRRAFPAISYPIAGYLMPTSPAELDRMIVTLVRQIPTEKGLGLEHRLLIGNLLALVANLDGSVSDDAMNTLLDACWRDDDPSLMFFVLSTLGYRCFRKGARLFNPKLVHRMRQEVTSGASPLRASLAWCYLEASDRKLPQHDLKTRAERPRLDCSDPAHVREVFAILGEEDDGESGEWIRPPQLRTVQAGMLRYLHQTAKQNDRLITAVHYAFCLVVIAREKGQGDLQSLAESLRPDSAFAQAVYRHSHELPGVEAIFRECQRAVPPGGGSTFDNLGLRGERLIENPYALLHKLPEKAPIFWSSEVGAWIVSSRELVEEVLAKTDEFRAARVRRQLAETRDSEFDDLREALELWLIYRDGDAHKDHREWLQKAFNSACEDGDRPAVTAIVDDCVEKLLERSAGKGTFDLVAALATPLPIAVITELMDLPSRGDPDFRRQLKELCDALIAFIGGALPRDASDPRSVARRANAAIRELIALMRSEIEKLRQSESSGIVKRLIDTQSKIGASEADLIAACIGMLVGGHETTTNLLGCSLVTLLRPEHAEQLRQLREKVCSQDDDRDAYIESAVDELLRFDSPVQRITRVASHAVKIGDDDRNDDRIRRRWIGKDQLVMLLLGSANRDGEHYDAPQELRLDRFVGDRSPYRHMAFGSRAHYCAGSTLGKLEVKTALTALLERFDHIELVPTTVEWGRNPTFRGPRRAEVVVREETRAPLQPQPPPPADGGELAAEPARDKDRKKRAGR